MTFELDAVSMSAVALADALWDKVAESTTHE
jgi:hypothetical protein